MFSEEVRRLQTPAAKIPIRDTARPQDVPYPSCRQDRHKGPKHCGILSESSVVVMATAVKQKLACGTLAQGFQHYHNNPVVTVRN
ncbi:hypothetical protein ROHU_002294 [Labeo rohita]|uniref:Uncharacterized protein n=1 Tax=Labeo rohita TaxID=84645 RepID=A0A498NZD4_LABRO|nr:hypothetical protein ROHU_002294 [Labeo rohita]